MMAQDGKKVLHFKLSSDLVVKMDNWRRKQPIIPSRVAVVRYAIERFVNQEPKKGRS